MATHSSILAWEIPWTEEPGGLQSAGSQELDATKPPPLVQHIVGCKGFYSALGRLQEQGNSGASHTTTFVPGVQYLAESQGCQLDIPSVWLRLYKEDWDGNFYLFCAMPQWLYTERPIFKPVLMCSPMLIASQEELPGSLLSSQTLLMVPTQIKC